MIKPAGRLKQLIIVIVVIKIIKNINKIKLFIVGTSQAQKNKRLKTALNSLFKKLVKDCLHNYKYIVNLLVSWL